MNTKTREVTKREMRTTQALVRTDDPEAVMKFLFDDETFSFETLRTAGFALYGGADLGEVLGTASAITDGDEASSRRPRRPTR